MHTKDALKLAELAAQLAKEDEGLYRTAKELATDALALFQAGLAVRKDKAKAVAAAKVITDIYKADLVQGRDVLGMTLGVRFRSGRFSNASDNVFYVS